VVNPTLKTVLKTEAENPSLNPPNFMV
jgi:hypothetical protein